jgi:hypothetical protein
MLPTRSLLRTAAEVLTTSVGFILLYAVLAGLSGTPARLEEIAHSTGDGFVAIEYLVSAILRDTNVNLIFFIAFWVVIWLALRAHHQFRGAPSRRFLFLLLFPFAVLVALAGFMSTEFKVERGIYPSWFDLGNAQGGTGVGLGYLKLALRPEILAGWVALALAALFLSEWMRRRQSTLRTWSVLVLVVVGAGGLADQIRFAWVQVSQRLPSILSASVTDSPLSSFVLKKKQSASNTYYGVSALLTGLSSQETTDAAAGLSLMGLNPAAAALWGTCSKGVNPVRQELDHAVPESPFGRELAGALRALSRALFEWHDVPVHLHQILVESFLSADFASLGSQMPEAALPFWNRLIRSARAPGSTTFVAGDMRQAGVRTSQAISASFCGLGTLSHHLSMGRDLQEIPIRCLPELLSDAGMVSEMHHGYRPEFDLRTRFFKDRRMDFWHIRRIGTDRTALSAFWEGDLGISDRKVVEFSLSRAARDAEGRSTYTGLLTLSSHRPFTVPGDMPERAQIEADAVTASLPERVASRPLTRERVRILRYVDGALEKYFQGISGLPKTARSVTLAVLYGDHSHADADIFSGLEPRTDSATLRALSRIPFLVHIFPESLAGHPRRAEVLRAIERLNRLLIRAPISQNDIPLLISGLLSHWRGLSRLPKAKRWHTLGGQRLSAHSRPPMRADSAVVWGVDGASRGYAVDSSGHPVLTEKQSPMAGPESLRARGMYQPISQALSIWLKHTQLTCKP